jgi:hypothetical protein
MYNLFSMAMLLMLAPQNQNLPDEFNQIPESIRQQATVIVSGTYGQGRTPCMFRPDGTRVWGLDWYFAIKRVYRGKVGSKVIRIKPASLPTSSYVSKGLKLEHRYLVLLRPGREKMKAIKTRDGVSFWDALRDEEIIAIVELR